MHCSLDLSNHDAAKFPRLGFRNHVPSGEKHLFPTNEKDHPVLYAARLCCTPGSPTYDPKYGDRLLQMYDTEGENNLSPDFDNTQQLDQFCAEWCELEDSLVGPPVTGQL